MYLLIDIGNTRIKWQQRDDKDILLTDSILVEEFMDIDFSSIKSIDKIIRAQKFGEIIFAIILVLFIILFFKLL